MLTLFKLFEQLSEADFKKTILPEKSQGIITINAVGRVFYSVLNNMRF